MFYSDFVEEVIKTWRKNKTDRASQHTYMCYALSETASRLRLQLGDVESCSWNSLHRIMEHQVRLGSASQVAINHKNGKKCCTLLEYLVRANAELLVPPDEVREAFLSCLYQKALAEDNGD